MCSLQTSTLAAAAAKLTRSAFPSVPCCCNMRCEATRASKVQVNRRELSRCEVQECPSNCAGSRRGRGRDDVPQVDDTGDKGQGMWYWKGQVGSESGKRETVDWTWIGGPGGQKKGGCPA